MTGGMAFVYDPHDRFPLFVNPDTVVFQRLASARWEDVLVDLVTEHVARTGSVRGQGLLENWESERRHFWQVCPIEMLSRLEFPLREPDADEIAAQ
jgi:glutamate synthase (NADPH/NADH) large chain